MTNQCDHSSCERNFPINYLNKEELFNPSLNGKFVPAIVYTVHQEQVIYNRSVDPARKTFRARYVSNGIAIFL